MRNDRFKRIFSISAADSIFMCLIIIIKLVVVINLLSPVIVTISDKDCTCRQYCYSTANQYCCVLSLGPPLLRDGVRERRRSHVPNPAGAQVRRDAGPLLLGRSHARATISPQTRSHLQARHSSTGWLWWSSTCMFGWQSFHSQAVSAWQRGAWQDWLGSCARWWNIQINVNPTQVLDHQSPCRTCINF